MICKDCRSVAPACVSLACSVYNHDPCLTLSRDGWRRLPNRTWRCYDCRVKRAARFGWKAVWREEGVPEDVLARRPG